MDVQKPRIKRIPLSKARKRNKRSRAVRAVHLKRKLNRKNEIDLEMECEDESSFLAAAKLRFSDAIKSAFVVNQTVNTEHSDSSEHELIVPTPCVERPRKLKIKEIIRKRQGARGRRPVQKLPSSVPTEITNFDNSDSSEDMIVRKPQRTYGRKPVLKTVQDVISLGQDTEPDIIVYRITTAEEDPIKIEETQITFTPKGVIFDHEEQSSSSEQEQINSSMAQQDRFEHFGRFIASVLKETTKEKAKKIQEDIIGLFLKEEPDSE